VIIFVTYVVRNIYLPDVRCVRFATISTYATTFTHVHHSLLPYQFSSPLMTTPLTQGKY